MRQISVPFVCVFVTFHEDMLDGFVMATVRTETVLPAANFEQLHVGVGASSAESVEECLQVSREAFRGHTWSFTLLHARVLLMQKVLKDGVPVFISWDL